MFLFFVKNKSIIDNKLVLQTTRQLSCGHFFRTIKNVVLTNMDILLYISTVFGKNVIHERTCAQVQVHHI